MYMKNSEKAKKLLLGEKCENCWYFGVLADCSAGVCARTNQNPEKVHVCGLYKKWGR